MYGDAIGYESWKQESGEKYYLKDATEHAAKARWWRDASPIERIDDQIKGDMETIGFLSGLPRAAKMISELLDGIQELQRKKAELEKRAAE